MRFLADESFDAAVVRALRAEGHHVACVVEFACGRPDSIVMEAARTEAAVLLTEDKDFGHLIFALSLPASGVILVRWPMHARGEMVRRVVELVHDLGDQLLQAFVVVEPGGVRVRPRPRL